MTGPITKYWEQQLEWMEDRGLGTISEEAYVIAYGLAGVEPEEARLIYKADIEVLEYYWEHHGAKEMREKENS